MMTSILRDLVRGYFSGQEWFITFEVGNGTGFDVKRHADAVAMNLWPSRGLSLHGVEIKASRTDWQKELANPAKAEEIHQYCDFWWLVTANGVVKDINEIPPGWGFMEMTKRDSLVEDENNAPKLKLRRQPTKQERPYLIDRGFVAGILRAQQRADSTEKTRMVNAAAEKISEEKVKYALAERDRQRNHAADRLAKLTAACDDAGLRYLDDDEICRAVAFVLKSDALSRFGGLYGILSKFKAAESSAKFSADELRKAAEMFGIPLPEERLL